MLDEYKYNSFSNSSTHILYIYLHNPQHTHTISYICVLSTFYATRHSVMLPLNLINKSSIQSTTTLTLMVCPRVVGYISSTSCFIAAVPLNKSNWVPGGSNPKRGTQTCHQDRAE